jgi:hypothetical protein
MGFANDARGVSGRKGWKVDDLFGDGDRTSLLGEGGTMVGGGTGFLCGELCLAVPTPVSDDLNVSPTPFESLVGLGVLLRSPKSSELSEFLDDRALVADSSMA